MFDLDDIFKKPKKLEIDKILPKEPEPKVIIHNHYYQLPNSKSYKRTNFRLTTLSGERMLNDSDRDGYPNLMDREPNNPNVPKKKLIWEKTLQSIYRSDKDD